MLKRRLLGIKTEVLAAVRGGISSQGGLRLNGSDRKQQLIIYGLVFGVIGIAITLVFAGGVSTSDEIDQYNRINAHRSVEHGRSGLQRSKCLTLAAREWSKTMASRGILSHSSADTLVAAYCPVQWRVIGENVAYGTNSVEIVNALLASSGHHANMDDSRFNLVGIGAYKDDNNPSKLWITQIFAMCEPGKCSSAWYETPDEVAAPPPSTTQPFTGAVGAAQKPDGNGYWVVDAAGQVLPYPAASFQGDMRGKSLNKPIVSMASTADGNGYWLVAEDGGIFAFNAPFYGSTGNIPLNKPVVGMAAHPLGGGYWMFASDGGIFAYGSAKFLGSTGAIRLNKPIVGMAPTKDGGGYWLVASDGGIFAFGNAGFFGSTGNITLSQPIVGMAASPTGKGYWLVARDGGLFAFGDAQFLGSAITKGISTTVVGMFAMPDGAGYKLIQAGGGASIDFGSAERQGLVIDYINTPPSVPANVRAFQPYSDYKNAHNMGLSWDASSDDRGVIGYKIYRNGVFHEQVTANNGNLSYTDSNTQPGAIYDYQVAALDNYDGESAKSAVLKVIVPGPPNGADLRTHQISTYLSDLTPYQTPVNGSGPIEKDKSTGTSAAGDGQPITLEKVSYLKGLGVHAVSDVRYTLGACTAFSAIIGVDDAVGTNGKVVFQVYGDGNLMYTSIPMDGSTPTQQVNLVLNANPTSVQQLRLVVNDGGNGLNYDHADWAAAEVYCNTSLTDKETPVTRLISPTQGSEVKVVTGTYTISAEGSDNVGIQQASIRLDGNTIARWQASPFSFGWDSRTTTDGSHYIQSIAWDPSGNSGTSANVHVIVYNGSDTSPPSAPAVTAVYAPSSKQSTVIWSQSTDNIGVVKYEIYRSDKGTTPIATVSAYNSSYGDTTIVAGQTYTYTVKAVDVANLKASSAVSASITIPAEDKIPPVTSITSPANNTFLKGTVNINFTASDNVGVYGDIYLKLDTLTTVGRKQSLPYTFTLNTADFPNGEHILQTKALDPSGNITLSNPVVVYFYNGLDVTAPTSPTSLIAKAASPTQANLTWNAGTDTGGAGLAGYKIYRNNVEIGTSTSSSYGDSKAVAGQNTYSVKAFDYAGLLSGAATYSITMPSSADTTAPFAPTGPTATPVTANKVNLAWNASTDNPSGPVSSYLVQRDGQVIGSTTSSTTFSDTKALPSVSYKYSFLAQDYSGNTSAAANAPTVTTPAVADSIAPTQPTNLSANPISTSQINLSWNASTDSGGSGLAKYSIYRSSPTQGKTLIDTIPASLNNPSYGDSSLAIGTQYTYTVQALDANGNPSLESTSASATTKTAAGTGLIGVYYYDKFLTNYSSERLDPTVNFNWGTGSPTTRIGVDNFSVRWTGKVVPPTTGTYQFQTVSTDGVRLWVNGVLLINNWTNHTSTTDTSTTSLRLNGGQKYDIKLEYYEASGGATMKLFWMNFNQTQMTIIPASQLYPN